MSTRFKIVLLGEGNVGKTSLLMRYMYDRFDDYHATRQAYYLEKTVFVEETEVTLSICDTGGQEKYHSLQSLYYREASGALLLYSVDDLDSFLRMKTWVTQLRRFAGSVPLCIVASKTDLPSSSRQVSSEEAQRYCSTNQFDYFETSSKADRNVRRCFLSLATRMLEARTQVQRSRSRHRTRVGSGESTPLLSIQGGIPIESFDVGGEESSSSRRRKRRRRRSKKGCCW